MTRYKPGPAKTRDGRDFYIHEVFDGKIYGRVKLPDGSWGSAIRYVDGSFFIDGAKVPEDLAPPPVEVSDATAAAYERAYGLIPHNRRKRLLALAAAIANHLAEMEDSE